MSTKKAPLVLGSVAAALAMAATSDLAAQNKQSAEQRAEGPRTGAGQSGRAPAVRLNLPPNVRIRGDLAALSPAALREIERMAKRMIESREQRAGDRLWSPWLSWVMSNVAVELIVVE